ncbi:MAG: RpiB/LacA/LacB family sugar-phosphate isomerase [Eubacteriales bacterium]|nr:RpiB/LacA/LacB family sugar-phosphate isomerase [Eubacteriales bacterium]
MKIAVGCDPNAEQFKIQLIQFIESLGHEVTDFGSTDPIYANVAIQVGEAVAAGKYEKGILFCGTGIGVMLAANKVKGAYAAVVGDVYSAQRACLSNNCNIITLGSQVTGIKLAEEIIREYLSRTYVYNERSGKKVDRILEYEKTHM